MYGNQRVKYIKELRQQRKTYQEIGDELGLSRQRVEQICLRNQIVKPSKPSLPTYEEKVKAKLLKAYFVNDKGCWEWTGTKVGGYGRLGWKGKSDYAHRVAWRVFKGPIVDDLCVCHKCDNPSCVNPDHLWLGTHQQNMIDRENKNRTAKGKRIK